MTDLYGLRRSKSNLNGDGTQNALDLAVLLRRAQFGQARFRSGRSCIAAIRTSWLFLSPLARIRHNPASIPVASSA